VTSIIELAEFCVGLSCARQVQRNEISAARRPVTRQLQ
jgi:hypothetical protein